MAADGQRPDADIAIRALYRAARETLDQLLQRVIDWTGEAREAGRCGASAELWPLPAGTVPRPVVPLTPRGVGGAVLVQTLREGEILQVGDDIRVHVRRLKGNRVTFVINAPEAVGIKRVRTLHRAGTQSSSTAPER